MRAHDPATRRSTSSTARRCGWRGATSTQRTDYDADPLDAARRWVDAGARALHVVDLDGARSGAPANLEHVERIADGRRGAGAGRRRPALARRGRARRRGRRGAGDPRHRGVRDPEFLDAGGRRATATGSSSRSTPAAASSPLRAGPSRPRSRCRTRSTPSERRGVRRFVYSSIERDGMLDGPDLDGRQGRRGDRSRQLHLLRRGLGARRT